MGKGFWGGNVGTLGWSITAPYQGKAFLFIIIKFITIENLRDFQSIYFNIKLVVKFMKSFSKYITSCVYVLLVT
jgi:hypothetical protein